MRVGIEKFFEAIEKDDPHPLPKYVVYLSTVEEIEKLFTWLNKNGFKWHNCEVYDFSKDTDMIPWLLDDRALNLLGGVHGRVATYESYGVQIVPFRDINFYTPPTYIEIEEDI